MAILLLNDTRRGGHHGSTTVARTILDEFVRRGLVVHSHLATTIDVDRLIENGVTAVVINGEGTMHSGQKGAHWFAKVARTARSQGVPAFLINATFAESTPEIIDGVRQFAGIYVRETMSRDQLRDLGIASQVCPDLTFALKNAPSWSAGSRVIVTDTTVAGMNPRLHAFARANHLQFLTLRTNPEFEIMRMIKFATHRNLGKLFPANYMMNRYSSAITGLGPFLQCLTQGVRVVVAARFHAVCFCLRTGVPFVALPSNTHKIEAMLADAGLGERMLRDLSLEAIEAQTPWTAEHEARRKAYVENAEKSIVAMFDTLSSVAGTKRHALT